MSELAHHDTDIETQKATERNINNVVPLQRKSEETMVYAEFSEMQATSMFMSTLRHEGKANLRRDDLAKIILDYLGQRDTTDLDSLRARLSQIVNESKADDETYNSRIAGDHVFAHIIEKLVSPTKNQNSSEQRSAARKMLDLRIELPDFETPDDDTWIAVIDRLMD